MKSTRVNPAVRDLLKGGGVPWRIIEGTRHFKVIVADKLCAILPKGAVARQTNQPGHAMQNSLAQIRRAIRSAKEQQQ